MDDREAFSAIHFRWLGLNHVNETGSEAKMQLQATIIEKSRHGTQKSMLLDISRHVKYYIILGKLMEYGDQCLDQG